MFIFLNHCDDGSCEACGAKILAYDGRLNAGGRKWLVRIGFTVEEVDAFETALSGKTVKEALVEVKGKEWRPDPKTKEVRLVCSG